MSQRNAVHVTDACPRDACHPIHPKPQKLETLFWSGNKKGGTSPATRRREADTGMAGYTQKITKGMANKMRKQRIKRKGILQG